ncbi:hypothetical protein SAMN05660845_2287 [Flavobacterium swingsii]|jgi:hypothetical protein|uniref:DUF4134 domain-containing protein n=1 Tax=Flavobacterium swingsii TaxID=498292 RepID=A0A1I0ZQB4_9FLAO|nr:hypothetical protein [Flavobacterium swingsii]SFB26558.1 hypothetical protein SAMN05660845_2287 [Flavobacterium swingsii]
MKKIIFIITFFLVTGRLLSQAETSPEFTKEDYLQKSKNQNTIGWVLVSSGIVMTVVGAIGFSNGMDDNDQSDSETDTYGFVMLAGPLVSLGSIPFFISSGRNSKKSIALTLSNQPNFASQQYAFVVRPEPSLTFKIVF